MNNRIISTLLLVSLLLTASACGNSHPSDTSVPAGSTESETPVTTDYLDTLPEMDMGGRDFIILAEDRGSNGIPNTHIGSESGDVLNDAVFRRDSAVEERYKVEIEYSVMDNREALAASARQTIMADEESFHLIMNAMTFGSSTLASSGLLYDMASLPDLSLDADWWLPSCNDKLYIGDSLYFAASPVAPTFFASPFGLTFNKRIAEEYRLPDIYQEVLDGTWTLDRMQELAKDVSRDLDSNGEMDENDMYGIAMHQSGLWSYYAASGQTPLVFHDDMSYDLMLGDEASVNAIQKLAEVFSNRDEVYYYDGRNTSHAQLFSEGRVLFSEYSMTGIMITYRDMADDFGIVPVPKLSAEQENYGTVLQTLLPCGVSVPITCSNPEQTGLILEMLAYLSDSGVRSAVYDVVLSGRVTRDAESEAMLDIIYGDINLDLLYIYRFGDAPNYVFDSIANGTPFVSAWDSIRSSVEAAIASMLKTVTGEE